MTTHASETREVRLRLIRQNSPQLLHEGEPTVFGLQDKGQAVQEGRVLEKLRKIIRVTVAYPEKV